MVGSVGGGGGAVLFILVDPFSEGCLCAGSHKSYFSCYIAKILLGVASSNNLTTEPRLKKKYFMTFASSEDSAQHTNYAHSDHYLSLHQYILHYPKVL